MNKKEAIVLAGGLGTRLQSVLPSFPKCMAPIKDKPFLVYVFEYLINQQINKVILSIGYRKDQIINYFGNEYRSLSIEYAIENEPLGTGGAIKLALNLCTQDEVFVVNGDTYFIPDLAAMQKLHNDKSADMSIAVKFLMETGRYGLVISDELGRITDFREKDMVSGSGWINGGIYLIKRQLFDGLSEKRFSIENDVFRISCSTLQMQAFQTDAFFLDMGIPEDYTRAQALLPSLQKI
jgi:D-glycero-alpha-D-manno-heptose 1-phosphate guanylyltransferase